MSPQDKVERVLKEIHVAFSKSPTYNGQPDKMIVDRKEFLMLLDRLNRGIYDMMEQYEQTRQSRANAERSFRRKGNEIIERANASADDIYAASVIYTADAIGRIRDLMDQTNDSMNDLFRQFRRELREQKDTLRSHESELQAQLADLADTKKYLDLLQDINRERERKNHGTGTAWEGEERLAQTSGRTAAPAAQVVVNEEYFKKPDAVQMERTETPAQTASEKPDIKVNEDAAYFKWKAEQERKKEEAGVSGSDVNEKAHADESPDEVSMSESEEMAGQNPGDLHSSDPAAGEESLPGASEQEFSGALSAEEDSGDAEESGFPDEEAIYQAVLEDERAAEAKQRETSGRDRHRTGGIWKTIIFGKDQ
ncbi:MAG: hypothetical protein LUC83_04290 [Clostridiales bacterium]|nr:hypothetical protein [Clostridiales bacterium]